MKKFILLIIVCLIESAVPSLASLNNVETNYNGNGVYSYTFFSGTLPLYIGFNESDPSFYTHVFDVEEAYPPAGWDYEIQEEWVVWTYTGSDFFEYDGNNYYAIGSEIITFSFLATHDPDYYLNQPDYDSKLWLGGRFVGRVLPAGDTVTSSNWYEDHWVSDPVGFTTYFWNGVPQSEPMEDGALDLGSHELIIREIHLLQTISLQGDYLVMQFSGLIPGQTYGLFSRNSAYEDWVMIDTIYTLQVDGVVNYEVPATGDQAFYMAHGWE